MIRSLGRLIDRAATGAPEATALVFGGTHISFAQLRRRTQELAGDLHDLGLGEGHLAAVCLGNSPDAVATLLAVWSLGAVVVDLNPSLTDGERRSVAGRYGTTALITASGVATGPPDLVRASGRVTSAEDPRLACINHTSGSTGEPKGVMLTHENLLRNAELYVRHFDLVPADRTCLVLPLFFGMNKIALLAHLLVGAAVVLEPNFLVPNQALAAMEAAGATGLCVVPAGVHALLSRGDLGRYPLRSMRYVRVGAGRFQPEQARAVRGAFPGATVYLTYGLTEVGLVAAMTSDELDGHPTSCGRVISEVEVTLSAADEVVVRAGHAALGYWNDPAGTADVFRPDGVHTGDIGRLDDHGYLSLTGREKELIKSGGENVHPAEVEAALLSHPAVAECAVLGVPDPWLGESIKAFVVPKPGHRLDEAALRRHANAVLTPIKRPKEYIVSRTIARTETGKVNRSALRSENT